MTSDGFGCFIIIDFFPLPSFFPLFFYPQQLNVVSPLLLLYHPQLVLKGEVSLDYMSKVTTIVIIVVHTL